MRAALTALLLIACAPVDPIDGDQPVVDDPVVDEEQPPEHVCDTAAREQFEQGQPWTAQQKEACFDGCEAGDAQGFDQGRLACILEDEACPRCVAEQDDAAYDAGYSACYAESYVTGYLDEGCEP